MKISLTNSKLGDKIPSLNLPALITCRHDVPCRKGCYACKGNFLFPNVKESLLNNLNDFLKDSEKFFNDIIEYLNNDDIQFKYFRWFSSGDIVNYEFLKGIVRVAENTSQTQFLCFTKKFNLVNEYLENNDIPSNLNIVFSGWDNTFEIENPYNLPTTIVKFKDASRNIDIPETAIQCNGSCKTCKACWNIKNGEMVYFNQH